MPENRDTPKQPPNNAESGPVPNGNDLTRLTATEPMENDPCIDNNDVNDVKPMRKETLVDKYVNEVGDRTGLSRRGVFIASAVVIAAVLFFVIVIALAAAWPKVPHKFAYPICGEGACLRAAAQISENMDKSKSPCDNLWQSMCGGWLKNHPLPKDKSIWSPKQQLIHREAEKVRDLVSTLPLPLHTLTVEWKLKHFYEACLDVQNINIDMARPLTNIISELDSLEAFWAQYRVTLIKLSSKIYTFECENEETPRAR